MRYRLPPRLLPRVKSRALQLAVAAISLQAAHSALAVSTSYTGVDGGSWATASNWTTSGSAHVVPVNGDDASLGGCTTVSTVIMNAINLSGIGLNSLTLNSPGHPSITLNQNVASGMVAINENIGTTVTANFYIQSAGTNSAFDMTIGVNSGSSGCYSLSGGNMSTSNLLIDGNAGVGTVALSGGNLSAAGNMTLGNASTGSGAFNISVTGNATVGTLYVGNMGLGAITQSGGCLSTTVSGVVVGLGNLTAQSTYTMTGGNLTINGNGTLAVGYGGLGCMSVSAGNISFTATSSAFFVGGNSGNSVGCFTLSGTGAISGALAESIGDTGCGTFTQNAGNNTIASTGELIIGNIGIATGTYNLNGGNLSVNQGSEYIGAGGNGTFTQMGGSNFINFAGAVGTGFYVGYNTGSNGNYNLQSGSLTTTFENEYIGYGGNGTFTESGGTNSVSTASTSGLLILGNSVGGVGCYTLSGTGVLSCGGDEYIGNGGNGTFTQTGGSNTLTGLGTVIVGTGGNGTYNLQGGNLIIGGSEYTADGGTATFNQTGGNNTVGAQFYVGASGSGTFSLSNGNLTVQGEEILGFNGIATFIQHSGVNSVSGGLLLAQFLPDTGSYNLLNGTLNVLNGENEVVGDDGTGSFSQFGGLNNVTGILIVGLNSGSVGGTGIYNMTGGTITAAGGEYVGQGTLAGFNQTAGINSMNGFGLAIGLFASAYNFAGGTLSTPAINVNAIPANFYWTGGTLILTNGVTFDPASTISTTSVAFGNNLYLTVGSVGGGTLNSPMNLIVTGTETIGGAAAFSLSVYAGTSDTATAISVAPLGILVQNGGTIVSNVTNVGVFYSTGGGTFTGQLINYANTTFNTSATISNGLNNIGVVAPLALGTTLTLNGAGLTNAGSITLAGGAITATVAANSGLIAGYGSLQGSPVSNSGTITQLGGPLLINSLTTGFNNTGTINGASGLQMTIAGLAITNDGYINLSGGTINIGPGLTNNFDGAITGPGKLVGIFANAGTLAVPAGALSISSSWSNTGLLTLTSPAALLGGAGGFTNSGSVQGTGTISEQVVTNTGSIEAIGGTLTFTNSVTNSAGGTLRTTAGTKILMQGTGVFSTNAGLIDLAGGTFDNSGHTLDNTGSIDGYGVLAASTITNDGAMLFTGGTATINANLVNSATKRVDIKFQPALFTGNITNNGIIKTWTTTVTYTGTLLNNPGSAYSSDPATNIFENNVTNAGSITGGPGDVYNFSSGSIINSGTFSNGGTLISADNITNTGTFTQTGPQTWSTGTTFTNNAGTATFGSDAGSPAASPLSIIVNAGVVSFSSDEHLASLNIQSGRASILSGTTKTSALTIGGTLNNWNGALDLTTAHVIVEDTSVNRSSDLTKYRNAVLPANTLSNTVGIYSTSAAAANLLAGRTDEVAVVSDNAIRMATFPTGSTNFGGGIGNVDASSILMTAAYLGDANLDGQVNILDLQDLANHWQQSVVDWSQADFNGDGLVNILDLQALANHWQFGVGQGNGSGESFSEALSTIPVFGSTAATPEPASLALLGLGGVALVSRRRK